jgi:hypothetical protein
MPAILEAHGIAEDRSKDVKDRSVLPRQVRLLSNATSLYIAANQRKKTLACSAIRGVCCCFCCAYSNDVLIWHGILELCMRSLGIVAG